MLEVIIMDELEEMASRIDAAYLLNQTKISTAGGTVVSWVLWLPTLERELRGTWSEIYNWCELYLEENQ